MLWVMRLGGERKRKMLARRDSCCWMSGYGHVMLLNVDGDLSHVADRSRHPCDLSCSCLLDVFRAEVECVVDKNWQSGGKLCAVKYARVGWTGREQGMEGRAESELT